MSNRIKEIEATSCPKNHEPIAPYFSNVYMTLLSVIQGMVIAGVFTIAWDDFKGEVPHNIANNSIFMKYPMHQYLILIILSIVIWHKYINHHQFLGWQIVWEDSVIMFSFGIMQGLLLFFTVQNNIWFYNIISIFPLLGALAYFHASQQHKQDYVKDIFYNHYCKREKCSNIIYDFMTSYEIKSIKINLKIFVIFIIFAFIVNIFNSLIVQIVISFLIIISLLIFLIMHDLKKMIKSQKLPCDKIK